MQFNTLFVFLVNGLAHTNIFLPLLAVHCSLPCDFMEAAAPRVSEQCGLCALRTKLVL